MRRWPFRTVAAIAPLATLCIATLPAGASGVAGAASTGAHIGRPWHIPSTVAANGHHQSLGAPAQSAAVAAAAALAQRTGKSVTVGALTTQTSTVSVAPDGLRTVTSYVLPVRVRQGGHWAPVSTALRRASTGMLSPSAVPDDSIAFSDGGSGPMASVAAGGTSLSLYWPGALPRPVVSGASATYPSVFPGVDLVLTATSAQTGGFREILVVKSPAAAAHVQHPACGCPPTVRRSPRRLAVASRRPSRTASVPLWHQLRRCGTPLS